MLFLASTFTVSFAQTAWTKYDGNPVLNPGPSGAWDDGFIAFAKIIFEGDKYHMWYAGGRGEVFTGIGYATSLDGISWTKYNDPTTTSDLYAESDPVLVAGQSGDWDDAVVSCPAVHVIDGTYHMWYGGSTDPNVFETASIGHAISADGISWAKDTLHNPVLTPGTSGSWDDVWIFRPFVLFTDGIYHMWYDAWNGVSNQVRIGHATTPHPDSAWTKDPDNPVLSFGSSVSWDWPRVDARSIIFDGNIYHMWYSGGGFFTWKIGYATSPDGIVWIKDTSNPVLNLGTSGSWDDKSVAFPSVMLDTTESIFKMWYTGSGSNWDGHIGYATSPCDSPCGPDGLFELENYNLPAGYVLRQNYPNPFNPNTTIKFSIPKTEFVTLKVYNLLGQEVATLVSETLNIGSYSYTWDADQLASGVYLYKLQAGDFVETKKMIFLK